jgi:hypothetical protein
MIHQLTSGNYEAFVQQKRVAAVHFDAAWDISYRPITRREMSEAATVLAEHVNLGEKPQPQTILVILIERFKFRDPYQKLLLEELGERCRITGDDMAFPVLYPFDQPVRAVENHFIRGILNL